VIAIVLHYFDASYTKLLHINKATLLSGRHLHVGRDEDQPAKKGGEGELDISICLVPLFCPSIVALPMMTEEGATHTVVAI
jgi:hypothetical protein